MLCCKLPRIDALSKPAGKWCQNAKVGTGCTIYETRPTPCRNFRCEWLYNSLLGDHWAPLKAKFYISAEGPNQTMIFVDPAYPASWKAPEYYPTIKLVAAQQMENGGSLSVRIGQRHIVVLPDRDEDVGLITPGQRILVTTVQTDQGPRYIVEVEQPAAS